ncbi:peptidase S41 [Ancylomarina euxinus]|uniref:Tricorn protease homolog n=1 Tax=Ancylomarina euxinus TaxID=2283627 RepID=A0A425XWH6_9BACT|nr:S41 family peptidase [Ancylomarina euxinus]MCZ4696436.1 S41 family peptidase [Ancylomarina euxinus]MUP16809.1 peptidase S41 [Ancylomarina euxinus]RRG18995.1 peptidase S41 [Ancylomarina euxinus]
MKKILVLMLCILSGTMLFAKESNQWIRYAAISPDGEQIAFSYKGDIYLIPSEGGEARNLTFHDAHDYMPVWNHAGTQICFASERYGNMDVFVVDVDGGQPTRLTYHSRDERPFSFSADDKNVIFGGQRLDTKEHRQYNTGSQPELYQVAVSGGRVEQIFTIPAEEVQVRKDGRELVYIDKKGGEDYFRKHHKSTITRDIWKYDVVTDTHSKITSFEGEDRNPIYSTDEKSLYYLSEESGCFNVHKMTIEKPSVNEQITDFKMHPVRYLSMANNGTLCYTHNGDLYTKAENQNPKLVKVEVRSEARHNNMKVLPVSGNIKEMAISPNGKEVAYIVRGEVFVSSVESKMTKRITNTPAQEQFVSFSPDGKAIMYSSERDAKWGIYQTKRVNEKEPYFFASTVLKEENVIVNDNENYQAEYSPDGKEIAFIENKTTLRIFNLEKKKSRTLMTPNELYYMGDGDQYYQWSPDSKWLLVSYAPTMANDESVLLSVDGSKEMINLTQSGYGDYSPTWVNEGKQILWFSNRNGMRSHANSGSKQMDVYSLFLTNDAWDKFHMSKDEYKLWKEISDKEKKDKEEKDKKDKKDSDKKDKKETDKDEKKETEVKAIKFDWDGLQDRKERLTIHSSKLGDAVLSKDGEDLYYLAKFEKGYNLWTTKLRTKETKMLMPLGAKSGSLQWDKEIETLFLLSDGHISTIDLKAKSKKSVATSSEMLLDLSAERQNMFNHVWKRVKSMFYVSDYHGVDWDALKVNYQAKLGSVGNDFEFSEMLSEMLGELNVSHCGARYYGGMSGADNTASLGVFFDYSYKGQGIKITEIIKNGPLDKEHIKIKSGMIIQHIDGLSIDTNVDFAKYLNRKAGQFTLLHVYDPATKKSQDITMKPISLRAEGDLLYERWIKMNEADVEELSQGKLGYVHLPGMSDGKYRDTYEKAMGKYFDKKGLIVDTRFNGGGDLVGDLSMFLTGVRFIDYAVEDRVLGFEPSYRWTKPSVALVGEAQYSDGSCFACGYQDLGIGKMIGMPVPGTCSFAGWEMLQNGNVLWGSVPVSAKNKKGEWMENNQTVPEVIIKNMPGKIDKGIDQQLEGAIEDLLKTVE